MRLIKVQAPEGRGDEIAQIAFAVGIPRLTTRQEQVCRPNARKETRDVVDVEVATPTAKQFIEAVMAAPFFDPKAYSIVVRQPRSIVSQHMPWQATRPLVEPSVDLLEELWQFSHITFGFVGRVFLGSLLLAYGMIENKLLVLIAGLLFLPLLPLLLAIGFGIRTREWRLARQGGQALLVSLALAFAAGLLVGLLVGPPFRFNEFNSPFVSFLLSLIVGIAAGLATVDDAGRREMIGLATAAQIAILPTWLGVITAFGLSPDGGSPVQRTLTLLLNIVTIIAAALGTYTLVGIRGTPLRNFTERASGAAD